MVLMICRPEHGGMIVDGLLAFLAAPHVLASEDAGDTWGETDSGVAGALRFPGNSRIQDRMKSNIKSRTNDVHSTQAPTFVGPDPDNVHHAFRRGSGRSDPES